MKTPTLGLAVLTATVMWAQPTVGSMLCRVLPVDMSRGAPLKLALTFDDGTRDHVEVVAPLLARHGWKGMFNIVTDWIGRPGKMTWDDVRALQRQGHAIASHTLSHPHLAQMLAKGETNEVRRQYRESREVILRETGRIPRYLCYPFTDRNETTDAMCREEGMLPMTIERWCFGRGTKVGTPKSAGAMIDRWLAEGRTQMDVLVHGVKPDVGWMPFDSVADYEAFLDEIADRERRGQVKVVTYDELCDFPDVTRWHGVNLLGLFNAVPKEPNQSAGGRFEEKYFRWLGDWGFNFARRYKGIPNVQLSFNLVNEPCFYENEYIDVFGRTIDAIRAEDPNRFVMLDGNIVAAEPVAHFYKVPLTGQAFRGYTPHAITHYGARWIKHQPEVEPTWPFSSEMAARTHWIYDQPEKTLAKYAAPRKIGYPVMVGEFGCLNTVSHKTCLAWMEHCLKLWQKHNLGWAVWNMDGAFGFMDSGRKDVEYEDFEGHKLDRKMLPRAERVQSRLG